MKRSAIVRPALAGLVACAIAAGVFFGLQAVGIGADDDDAEAETLSAPVRTRSVDGEIHVVLSGDELKASGIALAAPEQTTHQNRAAAFGTVIAPQTILDQRRAYQVAVGEVSLSEIAVRTARIEVQRLRPGGRDTVLAKQLEAAQAAVATEETNLRLANERLQMQKAELRQQWGAVVGQWLIDGAADLDDILAGRALLLQIALPSGRFVAKPAVAQIDLGAGEVLDARVLSDMPQADAKFPGQAFYAVTRAAPRVRPGMTLPVTVPIGEPMAGFAVPESAVLRWDGKPWVFVALHEGEFARRPIATEMPTPQGWLVSAETLNGTPVVVRGAQLLLSEEIKAQVEPAKKVESAKKRKAQVEEDDD